MMETKKNRNRNEGDAFQQTTVINYKNSRNKQRKLQSEVDFKQQRRSKPQYDDTYEIESKCLPYRNHLKNEHLSQESRNRHHTNNTILDDDIFHYFKRVAFQLQEPFPSKEDKDCFVENALEQTEGKELSLSRNKITSYIVQLLLEATDNIKIIRRFMTAFESEISVMICHPYGSHLVQCLLYQGLRSLNENNKVKSEESQTNDKDAKYISSWVLEVGNQCFTTLNEIIWDEFGHHVLCTLLEVLSGERVDQAVIRSKKSNQLRQSNTGTNSKDLLYDVSSPLSETEAIAVPDAFLELLSQFLQQVKDAKDLTEWICHTQTSAYLATAMLVVKKRKKLRVPLISYFINQIFPKNCQDKYPDLLTSDRGARLVETMFELASDKQLKRMWRRSLEKWLPQLAEHPRANYIAQKFILALKDKELFENVLNVISPHFENIIAVGQPGIWKCIAEASVRLNALQAQFMKIAMQALHCYEPEERQKSLVPLLLHLATYEAYHNEGSSLKSEINIHGSLLLQHMLNFNKPIKVVKSILSLQPEELKAIACDAKGSRVIDSFLQSSQVGEKNRDAFVECFKSQFCAFVCDKYGSHCMDNLWRVATLKQKAAILTELIKNESQLKSNYYANFFLSKCCLHQFKKSFSEWKKTQCSGGKANKHFQDDAEIPRAKKFRNKQ